MCKPIRIAGLIAFAALTWVACGGNNASTVDAFFTICGMPGDTGNADGVGKFCTTVDDCSSNSDAPLCATLGDPHAYFCTRTCTGGSGSGANCGDGATCTCQGSNDTPPCGCTPNSCLGSD